MHLVVHDQAPVTGVEQLQVGVDALPAGRHHLVRRDRDRRISFFAPEYSPISASVSVPEQLGAPLPGGDAGDEDQRRRLGFGHRAETDERLPCAARQHDHTGAAVPEAVDASRWYWRSAQPSWSRRTMS